jgi:hypothetical protein
MHPPRASHGQLYCISVRIASSICNFPARDLFAAQHAAPYDSEPVFIIENAGWTRNFAALQGKKITGILCGLQDFLTPQGGKRPVQTVV